MSDESYGKYNSIHLKYSIQQKREHLTEQLKEEIADLISADKEQEEKRSRISKILFGRSTIPESIDDVISNTKKYCYDGNWLNYYGWALDRHQQRKNHLAKLELVADTASEVFLTKSDVEFIFG